MKEIINMLQERFYSFTEPFDLQKGSLRNEYFIQKYYRDNFNFIHLIQVELTKETDTQSYDQNKHYVYRYVTILETVELLLRDENFRACCEYPRTSEDENILGAQLHSRCFFKNENATLL